MTTATFTRSAGIPVSSTQAKQVPAFSLRDLFDVFTSSLAMVCRALPCGAVLTGLHANKAPVAMLKSGNGKTHWAYL